MGWLDRIKNAFRPKASAKVDRTPTENEMIVVRRFDAAQTNKLNESQWRGAYGQHINQDIMDDLERLWARGAYELQNNPILEGIVNTFAIDVVGPVGPTLQIQSDDEVFNRGVERDWQDFFCLPEETQQMHGAEVAMSWIRSLCGFGEYFNQEVTIRREDSEVTLGIRQIDVRQLPIWGGLGISLSNQDRVAFSIEYNAQGRPLRYFVYPTDLAGQVQGIQGSPIPADLMNHVFRVLEPGQRRGIPWLAGALPVANDLRTFDRYVMTNAKNCAAQTTHWWTTHPDLNPMQFDEAKEHVLYEGSSTAGPPGWQPVNLQPMHPSAQYKEYRHERLRDLGRPICMPVMVVLLSAAGNTFSGAHYDGAVYMRNIKVVQRFLEQRSLNHYLRQIVRGFVSRDARNRRTPSRWKARWTWPVAPYVNPKDQYDAVRKRLEDGTLSYTGALGVYGEETDIVIAERVADTKKLAEAGLPPLPVRPSFSGAEPIADSEPDAGSESKDAAVKEGELADA